MNRRDFIKATGITTSGTVISQKGLWNENRIPANPTATGNSTITIDGNTLHIETKTLKAVMEEGLLKSLISKQTHEEFITVSDHNPVPVQLLFGKEVVSLDKEKYYSVTTRKITATSAEIIIHSWYGDAVLSVSVNEDSGELLVEPSAYSLRPGLLACRWNICNVKSSLDIVAPFFQGIKMQMDNALLRELRWKWPVDWEAALLIFESKSGGFWIHTRDEKLRYKAVQIGTQGKDSFGVESEAYGPIDDNKSAGGICWRINVFSSDWHTPAAIYRHWYRTSFDSQAARNRRPQWYDKIKLVITYCPSDPAILVALSKKIAPEKVLIHLSTWRTFPYDVNYPDYSSTPAAKAFIIKAQKMGFRVMPHFNAVDLDPGNPVFEQVKDFAYRDVIQKTLMGWSWDGIRYIGVPETHYALTRNRDKTVMVKIHPGSAMWRSINTGQIQKAVDELSLKEIYLDVTLSLWNLTNCFIEGQTPIEGMLKLMDQIRMLGNGITIIGEGRNEINARAQAFSLTHLFRHGLHKGYEHSGICDLNNFLFEGLSRSFGNNYISGKDESERLRMQVHLNHGAIPTFNVRSAEEISHPNKGVLEMLRVANR